MKPTNVSKKEAMDRFIEVWEMATKDSERADWIRIEVQVGSDDRENYPNYQIHEYSAGWSNYDNDQSDDGAPQKFTRHYDWSKQYFIVGIPHDVLVLVDELKYAPFDIPELAAELFEFGVKSYLKAREWKESNDE